MPSLFADLFERIRKAWSDFLAARRLAAEVSPESFRRMALEIRELAEAATQVCPPEKSIQTRIDRIRQEMDQLTRLTEMPEFRRLPTQRKLELREGLHQSRDQLLESMQTAPTPTRLLQ